MANSIEKEIHAAMKELALDVLDPQEQGIIIAEASNILESQGFTKVASKSKRESILLDALLEATVKLSDWDVQNYRTASKVESDYYGELFKTKFVETDLGDIINHEVKGHENKDSDMIDLKPEHPPTQYRKPGTGKSRVDITHNTY